jgi:hypothetical protein
MRKNIVCVSSDSVCRVNTSDISEIKSIISPSDKRLCRGQSNKRWTLNCSFFRKKKKKYISCKKLFGETWDDADDNPLKTTFPPCLDNQAINIFPHLGFLVQLQQNHTKKTPLLDVSCEIYMPLFCACGEGKENMDKDGKIFVIERLDFVGYGYELEHSELNVLNNYNIPTYNDRMRKQAGAMLRTTGIIAGSGKLCFCDIGMAKNKKVSEFIIPQKLKPEILKNLAEELKTSDLEEYFYGEKRV